MTNRIYSGCLALLITAAWTEAIGSMTAQADEPSAGARIVTDQEPAISLLNAMDQGEVAVKAEGLGDGRISLTVSNRSRSPLKIVLPPGIIASASTGQMGGMMGGGMGGMGGGMGGMGGGMGGMGGGMRGGAMLTMPSSMGMMMLGRIIMTLTPSSGEQDTWNMSSLMIGMMGGMGGGMGGMGGMGGGMGGMGGGMGGMGGMRSVPPMGLPFTTLEPGQTRSLPTRMISLSPPTETGSVAAPAKGELLRVGAITDTKANAMTQHALKRLAEDMAPQAMAQMVMWNVADGLEWDTIATITKGWANHHELALARQFVAKLDSLGDGESGRLYIEFRTKDANLRSLSTELNALIHDRLVLGLRSQWGVPVRPDGPAVGCRVMLQGDAKNPEGLAQITMTNEEGTAWIPAGKFVIALPKNLMVRETIPAFADALASGLLDRLVVARLSKAHKTKGNEIYQVRIDNYSPLILNGLAIASVSESGEAPKILAGICLPPRKSLTVPATSNVVESLGLKHGVRVVGADLSGL